MDAQVIIFTGRGGAWPPALLSKIGNICSSWVRQSRHISEIFKFILSSSLMLNVLLITKHINTLHMYFHFIPCQNWQRIISLEPKIPSWKIELSNKDVKFDDDKYKTLTKPTCFGVSIMTSLQAWQPRNHGSIFGKGRIFSSSLMRWCNFASADLSRPPGYYSVVTAGMDEAAGWFRLVKG